MSERTVKVRIAVAVDEDGNWCAVGATHASDGEVMGTCMIEMESTNLATYYVIAEVDRPLPIPVPQTVAGTALPAES